jgi:glycosyltransferase involved in cell wall biosynthesis
MSNGNHRIVLVSGGIGLGGATTFLLNLAGELVRRDLPVLVVSLEYKNPYKHDFERLRIPLHIDDERCIFEDRVSSALRVIRRFEPTAVLACLGPSSYEVLRYVPKSVTRLAVLQSDFPENYVPLTSYISFLGGIVGVSRQIETNLRGHPVLGRVPSYYLPYGVGIPKDQTSRPRSRNEPIRILYLGRVCRPQKRVHLFPEILRQLKTADIRFEWTIAGDGPALWRLKREMISEAPASVVRFTGAVDYSHVPQLLRSHDIFLLASDAEGLPLSLLEGMAYGLVPVVSNIKSGVSEVVDAKCGILVEPEDVAGYAAGILELSKNPAAFAAMSEEAAEKVRTHFSVEAMTDRWLALLLKLKKQEDVKWPEAFAVGGPLNGSTLRHLPPVRTLRRLVLRWTTGRTREQLLPSHNK